MGFKRKNKLNLLKNPKGGCKCPNKGLFSNPMNTSIYAYVMVQLQAHKGRWPNVAERSGVSRRTIEKIARGEIKDPGVSHIEKLAQFFHSEDAAVRTSFSPYITYSKGKPNEA